MKSWGKPTVFWYSCKVTNCLVADEGALVRAARHLRFVFTGRTPDSVIIESVSTLE